MIMYSFLGVTHCSTNLSLGLLAEAANLSIALCYFAIGTPIARGLWYNRKQGVDVTAAVATAIFFSCALSCAARGIGIAGLADTLVWQTCFDGLTVILAIAFLWKHRNSGVLVRFSQIIRSKVELEERNAVLEQMVDERTRELKEQNLRLNEALAETKQMQMQLVQTEKMSMLGQMVSGISHEINNPINFIYGNLPFVEEYVKDIIKALQVYQTCAGETVDMDELESVDLEFALKDLPCVIDSIKMGTERIRELVINMRNFYRLDESLMKPTDLHGGIDSTLVLLQNRYDRKNIEIVRHFGDIPLVECYINQLNQVFMNLLANAIDALLEVSATSKQIAIATQRIGPDRVAVTISDNGPGMPQEVQQHLFEPFFTTKPMGIGTGLGLSICHHIVNETHGGRIYCCSDPGKGTTFFVELPICHSAGLEAKEIGVMAKK